MLERDVDKKIKRELDKAGFLNWKSHGGPNQTRGLPDRFCCYKGLFVGIEIKTPKTRKNLTLKQKVTLLKIKQAGGIAVVMWDPKQVEKLVRICERRLSKA